MCLLDTARQGVIIAYDVNTSTGAIATPTIIDYFPGPSGATPVLIPNLTASDGTTSYTGNGLFFDGVTHASGSPPTSVSACNPTDGLSSGYPTGLAISGCFYGVIDTVTGSAHRIWSNIYPGDQFQIGAGLDPRGGLWEFPLNGVSRGSPSSSVCTAGATTPPFDNCLIELNPVTGALIGSAINLTPIITYLDGGMAHPDLVTASDAYVPSSDVTVSTSGSGSTYKVYLTVGSIDMGRPNPRAVNIDVTAYDPASTATSFTPVGVWVTPQGGDFSSATLGQFATIQYTDGTGNPHNRTVFCGANFGPYYFGY